jgi:hypothetical protein
MNLESRLGDLTKHINDKQIDINSALVLNQNTENMISTTQ